MSQASPTFIVSILSEINQEQKDGSPITFERMCQIAGGKIFQQWEETKQQPQDLLLQGRSTDSIWVIGDGQEPYTLGLRRSGSAAVEVDDPNSLSLELCARRPLVLEDSWPAI